MYITLADLIQWSIMLKALVALVYEICKEIKK